MGKSIRRTKAQYWSLKNLAHNKKQPLLYVINILQVFIVDLANI